MKPYFFTILLSVCHLSMAQPSWLDRVIDPDKKQQMELRWTTNGGQVDIQFAYPKLKLMGISVIPEPLHTLKSWDKNHLVFTINPLSKLSIQAPYGSIESFTGGNLLIDANLTLSTQLKSLNITTLKFIPIPQKKDDFDIVTFKIIDQNNNHLFTTDSIHVDYDKKKKLLMMNNMDIFASSRLAQIFSMPALKNQGFGQINSYMPLNIPQETQFGLKGGGNCISNPTWNSATNSTDIQLVDIGVIDWKGLVSGSGKVIIAPSAQLLNIGTADVPWYEQFTSDSPPYNNDQHPFLNWMVYRETDNRFEQIGISGVKHAFFSTNVGCSCPGGHVLGVGCGDVYSSFNNDNPQYLAPRDEVSSFAGLWGNCGSFFDPLPCTGTQQNISGGSSTGDNRLSIYPDDIVGNLYMQAWYVIRDDINIFNSMGYRQFSPTLINSTWVMNPSATFNNGPALNNYVPVNTISSMQASQSITSTEGHFTVAVKVIDLGSGLYRYNYAIENYDFDPKFINYHIPMPDSVQFSNQIFVDLEQDTVNSWLFSRSNNTLNITGNAANQQGWGELFSFSFTSNTAPAKGKITIDAAAPVLNASVTATTLIPDTLFKSGFE